jgi:succinoglycan biosynthesis protein ExoM
MRKLTTVDVCIATYKRPEMLSELLISLRRQDLTGICLRIVVIDNDRDRSACEVVEAFRKISLVDVVYDVEPQQNIALARNRAMSHVSSSYFAFVDDDEYVSRNWLVSLLHSAFKYKADVVFGPVIRTLPTNAPRWAAKCFHMQRRKTGELLQFGGAGNVMVSRSVIASEVVQFDPGFGLTGGEDTEFFYRLFRSGRSLVWCDEAIVTESVPDTRLTLQWVRRRGFRGGQTYKRIFVDRISRIGKLRWFAIKVVHLVSGLIAAPLLCLISYPTYVMLTVKIASTFGQLSVCFSRKYFEEYNN